MSNTTTNNLHLQSLGSFRATTTTVTSAVFTSLTTTIESAPQQFTLAKSTVGTTKT